ncbi:MAG: two-component regulator propeller domain-containing protein [Bacteroidia bacterium]
MKTRLFIILISLFYLSEISVAQYTDWIYLAKNSSPPSLAEEGNFIWMSSSSGVIKMHKTTGNKTYFNRTNCLIEDDELGQVLVDKNHIKWFTSYKIGVLRFDDTNWSVFDTSNSPLPYPFQGALTSDTSGNLWVATSRNGIMKYDGVNWTIFNTSNSGLPSIYVSAIYADGNIIWISTNVGISKFDGVNWVNYNTSNSNISSFSTIGFCKDRLGNLWLLQPDGIQKFNGSTFSSYNINNTNLQNAFLNGIAADTNNIIWVTCSSQGYNPVILGGLYSFNGISWTKYDSTTSPLSGSDYSSLLIDKSGSIWVGEIGHGLTEKKSNSAWSVFDPSNTQLYGNMVRQIVFDNNTEAFIGTGYGTFNPLHGPSDNSNLVKYYGNVWTQLNGHYTSLSWALSSDKHGNIYSKTRTSVDKFDGASWTVNPCPLTLYAYATGLDVSAFAVDSFSDGIWIDYMDTIYVKRDSLGNVTSSYLSEGIGYFNGNTWTKITHKNSPLPDSIRISMIKVDRLGNIWCCSNRGLFKYNGSNWTIYNTLNSTLPSNNIGAITFDLSNNIWFTVQNIGFVKFDGTNCTTYPHPTLNPYLGYPIIETDASGKIWYAEAGILIGFDGVNWINFDWENSPLPSGNIKCISADKFGNIWIGTYLGVFVYQKGGAILKSFPEIQKTEPVVKIYPNPSQGSFQFSSDKYAINTISVYNLMGEKVYSSAGNKNQQTVELNQPNGVYTVLIKTEKGTFNSKLVIQK